MTLLNILAICLISVFAINCVECSTLPAASGFKVRTVESIEEYLKQNPEIELQPLDVVEETVFDGVTPKVQIAHRIGSRVSGDRLLATDSANHQYDTPHDVKMSLRYPDSGFGAVITYLEVIVEQSSNLSQSYVTNGGIGQRHIEILIESQNTTYFKHRASIYGY